MPFLIGLFAHASITLSPIIAISLHRSPSLSPSPLRYIFSNLYPLRRPRRQLRPLRPRAPIPFKKQTLLVVIVFPFPSSFNLNSYPWFPYSKKPQKRKKTTLYSHLLCINNGFVESWLSWQVIISITSNYSHERRFMWLAIAQIIPL